jgi:hypothetical protein
MYVKVVIDWLSAAVRSPAFGASSPEGGIGHQLL